MRDSRRIARIGALLVLLGLITAAVSGAASGGATAKSNGPDPALVKKLKDKARGSVALSTKQATKHIGFVRAGQNGDLLPDNSGSAEAKAKAFLSEYGAILGAGNESTLEEISSATDELGATHVTYQQFYKGVPVWGGTIKSHTDAKGNLTAVNGVAVPEISLDTTPRLSAAEAGARAIATVVADPPTDESGAAAKLSANELRADAKLYVYRLGLPKGAEGTNELVYEVAVTNGSNVRDLVFVHASTGKPVNRYSENPDALHRVLYESNPNTTPVWEEGQPFPGSLNGDQQNLVNFSGHSYYHFDNAFGRDSYDGLGAFMRTVNNDPTIACPNANWNGATTNYCNGVTSDDVVAHEWAHAYTQYTHDLIYQWQPGALNEAYSDIWGETVDLINGAGTDSPGAVRTVGACSIYSGGRVVVINSPASIARVCQAGTASFGPPVSGAGVTGDIVLADDGVADPSTSNGCTAFVNNVAGKVALVDRGVCGFAVKVKNAQNAGAIAVVVANNVEAVQGMGGADPTITIPSLLIALSNGTAIKGELTAGNTVNVTLKQDPPAGSQDSFRWLMGEDSTAFGGAIRDMWTPTCLGDPGKVSDAQYHCDTSDQGGVHSNSGVPNHGYALLVDGGMFNGQTVTSIGLVKASHIYWRAQSVYQIMTTDFADHATALEASCQDLIGVPLEGLSTTSTPAGPSGQSISTLDCASVAAMIVAVELRTDPTQCNFQPVLDKNTPKLCAGQKNPSVHYVEDFEDGLTGWSVSNMGVFAGWPGTNWAQATSLPGGRAGSAAFGEDIQGGDCLGGAGDISGVMRLTSPSITLPNTATLSPRLSFEHYIATEHGWDGGNLKISVNGGGFAIVPASAFTFNPYNATLQGPGTPQQPNNTNPLAGEAAFTGTDGGEVFGSWGQSQIDLTKIGVKKGDTFQLRFDFGMDGCTGVDGWYVDDIKVSSCNTKKGASVSARND